jgi:hypothetical protein
MKENQNTSGNWEGLPLVGIGNPGNRKNGRHPTVMTQSHAQFSIENHHKRVIDPKAVMILGSILALFNTNPNQQKGGPSRTSALHSSRLILR